MKRTWFILALLLVGCVGRPVATPDVPSMPDGYEDDGQDVDQPITIDI